MKNSCNKVNILSAIVEILMFAVVISLSLMRRLFFECGGNC